MEYFGYIYETTNIVNGRKYIGKKKSPVFDESYLGSGILLQKAIEKYGHHNFTTVVLKWCKTREELNESEKAFISENNAYKSNDFYNIAAGGEGGNTYAGKTEEEMFLIKKKISHGNCGSRNGNKGQYRGEKNSMFGKKHSKESRQKISEASKKIIVNRSHPWTPEKDEKRKKTLERFTKYWKVIDLETGNVFENYTNRMIWIKSVFPEVYETLDNLDKLEINRCGVFTFSNIVIDVKKIDKSKLSSDEIQYYNDIHQKYKEYIYDRHLTYMKEYREKKREIKKCNDYRKHYSEEKSEIGSE
jgi:hypothetical protein